MTTHPPRCQACQGTGWQPSLPLAESAGGRAVSYTTLRPCDHDWWRDDAGWDPYRDEWLDREDPRARAAYARGLAQGRAERSAWGEPPCPCCRRPTSPAEVTPQSDRLVNGGLRFA